MIAQLDRDYLRTRPHKAMTRLLSYGLFEGRPLTTRGRWINPLVLAQFSLLKRLPQPRRVRQPIFVLGTGRSGTTILGKVLSLHREVGFLNEPKALWHSVVADEDVIGSYSSGPARYRLSAEDASAAVREAAHKLYGYYLSVTGAKRVLDKYPEMIFRVPFLRAVFPDARFLLLVRNGWDTITSIEQWSQRLGGQVAGETHDWWGRDRRKWRLLLEQLAPQEPLLRPYLKQLAAFERHEEMAATEWIITMQEGLRLLEPAPADVLLVKYEELAAAPRESLTRVLEFAELPPDETMLAYAQRTLRPTPHRPPVQLAAPLREAFTRTLTQLGYVAAQPAQPPGRR